MALPHTTAHLQATHPTLVREDPALAELGGKIADIIDLLGLDADDPHLTGTPARVAKAYREIFAGVGAPPPNLTCFPNVERYHDLLAVTGIPFYSTCAHHLLPFFGRAHVGYVPGDSIVGLSKLARVVEHFARRPQVQERLTTDTADLLDEALSPRGVMVVLEARHLCMEMRGVGRPDLWTTTVATRGILEQPAWRDRMQARVDQRLTTREVV